ncbi:MAG: Gluconate transporter family protein [uncultured Caballeronia sp.]|nr:MAG: Gluconate transporter family protein [uncultured Caballeronia sp.]
MRDRRRPAVRADDPQNRQELPDTNAFSDQFTEKHGDTQKKRELPGFGITLFTILLPVILMLVGRSRRTWFLRRRRCPTICCASSASRIWRS